MNILPYLCLVPFVLLMVVLAVGRHMCSTNDALLEQ